MEIHNRFNKGLHTDFDPQDQPQDTYRNGQNLMRDLNGTITPEPGSRISTHLPEGMHVIGSLTLNNDVVLFLCDETNGYSEIGYAPEGKNYRSVITNLVSPFNTISTVVLTSNGLGFKKENPVRAEGRVNYRQHRLVYFIDGIHPARLLDLDSPSTTVEGLNSFLTSIMPEVKVSSITEDGNLPTGVYQFAVRLLTSSGNKTTASVITNPVPIGDGSRTTSSTKYDGAPEQTESNKSINLEVTRIDQKYKFIELIAITYLGQSNQFNAHVVETKSITGSTAVFKYASVTQQKDQVELLEVTIDPITYEVPKTIVQKDNRLLYGNVQARKFNPDMQAVANQVILKYVIKEMDYSENIVVQSGRGGVDSKDNGTGSAEYNNYKDPLNVMDFTGYQRDEVYSFALVPIFRDFSFGYAYHIPGVHPHPTSANKTTNMLGTFVSKDHEYPAGFGFPAGKVKYHRMPNMQQEPMFDHNNSKIRVIGIEALNVDMTRLNSEERSNIIGFALTRELRTEENKSILAQGIMNTLMRGFHDDGSLDPNLRMVSPWVGKASWRYAGENTQPYDYAMGAFYSPDTTIINSNVGGATHVRQVATMQGTTVITKDRRAGTGKKEANVFLNYTHIWGHDPLNTQYQPVPLQFGVTSYIPADNGIIPLGTTNRSIYTAGSNGFVVMQTSSGTMPVFSNTVTQDRIPSGVGPKAEMSYEYADGTGQIRLWVNGDVLQSQDQADYRGKTMRALINVLADRPNQYGTVLDKEYIMIGYKLVDADVESIVCFGGDTFINKTSIVSTTGSTQPTNEYEFRTLNYFWCESSVNTAYRHQYAEGGVYHNLPYYPAKVEFNTSTYDGILDIWPGLGHANGYNRQYDFENTLKKFFSKPLLLEEDVTSFSNRVIYSEQAIEGEQFDAYRQFLTNNYHDVSKNKGEITDLFVFNGSLYIHTPKTLFKALMNEQTTIVSSSGEMVLGNGGLFPMPSKEVFTISGGYAGTTSPMASCSTPFGRLFLDNLQGKVFILGEGLSEISAQGMSEYFSKWVKPGQKYTSAYDYKNKRWILSGITIDGVFTISYSTLLQSWSSYHTYYPTHLTSFNDTVLMTNHLSEVHSLDSNVHGVYFNEPVVPMVLGLVANTSAGESKAFDALVLHTSCESYLGETLPWKTFSAFKGWNRIQNTGERTIFVPRDFTENIRKTDFTEVKANLKNNEFRIAIPMDLVVDPSKSVHLASNLVSDPSFTDHDRMFRPRMKGKHVELEFKYDNEPSAKFKVHAISTIIRPVSG